MSTIEATRKRPGRPKTLIEPNGTYPLVLFDEQVAALDRIAGRRRSRSEVAREAIDLFLAVNRGFVTRDDRHTTGETGEAA